MIQVPVPAAALPHRMPRQLVNRAREGLTEAATIPTAGMRYATAHLAALRAAAAVLAARTVATPRGWRSTNIDVWALLLAVAPELNEWTQYFANGSAKRASAEAGIPRAVTMKEADAHLHAAGRFVDVVEQMVTSPVAGR